MDQAVSVIDRPAGIVEVLRLGLEPSQDALVEVPGAVVVARLHATDRFEETGGDGVRARLSLGRSDFLDEAFDAASDEVDEGNVEGATGVGDQRDRAFDVPPFACLDRVVDDPLPFLDLEADPFRGDEERLDFVHELREFAVQEFAIARRDAAFRLLAGVPQRIQTTLESRARRPCRRDRGRDDPRGRRLRWLQDLRRRVRGHGGLAHGTFVFRRLALGKLRAAGRTHRRIGGHEGLADGAEEFLAEFPGHGGRGRRLDFSRFRRAARHALQGLDDLAVVLLAVHDRGEDVVDAPAVLDRDFDGIRRPTRQVE